MSEENTGIVIDMIAGRSDESVEKLCQTALNEQQRNAVITVCTDMRQLYIKGVNTYFPNALHCHDPFHCVGYLNRAVDKCRKREVKQHEDLRKTKYLWLKDQMNLTHIQYDKFQSIRNCNYEVSRAWRVKENFRDILFRQSQAGAVTMFHIWKHDVKNENIKEINDVVDMFDRHQSGIINAIKTGANNARAERLNGAIQELKTIGRGYAFRWAILFSLVILACFHTIPRRTNI